MVNRRSFLELAGSSAAAVILPSAESLSQSRSLKYSRIKFLATNWGFNGSIDQFCAAAKKEGYDGIEVWWPEEKRAQDAIFSAVEKEGLEIAFLCGAHSSVFSEQLALFKSMTQAAATNTSKRPLYVNCHSGRDHFAFEENMQLIEHTVALSRKTGVKIAHETHRSRILYAAPVAKTFFEKNAEFRITFDVSHWCNVSESYLQDQQSTVDMALQRVDAIHARVGHPEGPQVNDPRAPEWAQAVRIHLSWWDKIVELKKKEQDSITFLTEFGPTDYMPAIPYTRQPVADQWEINVYMMKMLRERYL